MVSLTGRCPARHDRICHKLMRDKMEELEVPPVREYLQMLVDAGAKLYACKMTVDMNNLSKDDFVDGVIDVVTAADFIDDD